MSSRTEYKRQWRKKRDLKIPIYKDIMYKYLPINTKLKFLDKPIEHSLINNLQLDAYTYKNDNGYVIVTPKIKRKKNLLTFLHEVGHITFNHLDSTIAENMSDSLKEEEANKFVEIICKRENINLSKTELYYLCYSAKNYKKISQQDVLFLISQAFKMEDKI